MNTDRFKFRVWHEESKKFYMDIRDELFVGLDGNIYFASVSSRELLFKHEETRKCHYILEQCTGIKDQSGKLIYEGDVVEYYVPMADENYQGVVTFDDDEDTASGYYIKGNREGWQSYLEGSHCRVIGNIHEQETMQ